MEQEMEKKKENKKRRLAQIPMPAFFGVLIFLLFLMMHGDQLSRELEINGKLVFTFEDKGSYMMVLRNQIVTGSDMADQLRGKFELGDRITKLSGTSELLIHRDHEMIKLELQFTNELEPDGE
ncbi:MAG: hypothetical protein RLO17_05780 [Cyclobacteriaceae bacterium]